MSAQPTDGTTPRPWSLHPGDWEFHPHVVGPDGQYVGAGDDVADHALIVAAVNSYDRLRTVAALAKGWVDALYGGVEGGRPTTDAGILRAVADIFDQADDTRDGFVGSKADRSIQADLRRIAADLERLLAIETAAQLKRNVWFLSSDPPRFKPGEEWIAVSAADFYALRAALARPAEEERR